MYAAGGHFMIRAANSQARMFFCVVELSLGFVVAICQRISDEITSKNLRTLGCTRGVLEWKGGSSGL